MRNKFPAISNFLKGGHTRGRYTSGDMINVRSHMSHVGDQKRIVGVGYRNVGQAVACDM